jgi:hypothetical protein
MSSSRITGSSGCRVSRTNLAIERLPRAWFASRIAVRSEKDSSAIATTSTATAIHQADRGFGCCHLCQPSYRENSPPTRNSTIATTNP